jgi:lipid A disaccharide synthetase
LEVIIIITGEVSGDLIGEMIFITIDLDHHLQTIIITWVDQEDFKCREVLKYTSLF